MIFIGWTLNKILHLELNINKYNPLRASSYVQLPKSISDRKAVVNIKNNDQCCFAWSIVSALYPVQTNSDRLSSYPHFSEILNFTNINFPVKLKDIKKFEELNDISINIYGLESTSDKTEVVGPLHYTKKSVGFMSIYFFLEMS